MAVVKINALDGTHTVGGTKILLADGSTQVFLDFGLNFSMHKQFFSEFLQPRTDSQLTDYLSLGLLPTIAVEQLYRQDALYHLGFTPKEASFVQAVILSHAHVDHGGCLRFLRHEIPLVCSEVTQRILESQDAIKNNQNLTLKHSFHFAIPKRKTSAPYTRPRGGEPYTRTTQTESQVQIDPLTVTSYPVDHSLPGCRGYLIDTSAGAVVYTGDLRLHGYHGATTEQFVKAAAAVDPILLIIEGTNAANDRKPRTEQEVLTKISEEIAGTEQLVLGKFPTWDLDRLLSFYTAAKENDRILLISFNQAYLLKKLEPLGLGYPSLTDAHLGILLPRRNWGLYEGYVNVPESGWGKLMKEPFKSSIENIPNLIKQDYKIWEREFLDLPNAYSGDYVRTHQSELVVFCSFFDLKHLLDFHPAPGSKFIWSDTSPYDEESVFDYTRVEAWMQHFQIPIVPAHASGHLMLSEIVEIVEQLGPKYVLPVHTEHPEVFKKILKNVQVMGKQVFEL